MNTLQDTLGKRAAAILFSVALFIIVLEAGLRLQQKLGPLFDMNFSKYHRGLLSDVINHKPHPQEGYDEDGIRISHNRPYEFRGEPDAVKILFMGDSFMHGFPDWYTIPHRAWEYLQTTLLKSRPLYFWNAGYSSYAPTIYTAQAKLLIPKKQAGWIVLAIDETDLIDDYANYRGRLITDDAGKIAGVKRSEPYHIFIEGYEEIRRQPFYAARLLQLFYHKNVRMPAVEKKHRLQYKAKYYKHPLSDRNRRFSYNLAASFDPQASAEDYADEIAFFRKNMRELLETLTGLLGGPEKILILTHPHLHHLIPDPQGYLWKARVAPILRELTAEYGIEFYDVTEDMRNAFGDHPENFYIQDDMHFNYEGLDVYGRLVGQRLAGELGAASTGQEK